MAEQGRRSTGLTNDVGYQIGVRRTSPIALGDAWLLSIPSTGVDLYLGPGATLDFTAKAICRLADGDPTGMRVFIPHSHLRVTWPTSKTGLPPRTMPASQLPSKEGNCSGG